MVRFFRGRAPVQAEIDTQQEHLRKLSGDVLRRYLKELNAEVNDPDRLRAVYGAGFADADFRAQAETVARLATQMLHVPNAAVNVVSDEAQDSVALVQNEQIQTEQLHLPLRESYCKYVIATGREMSVENALQHPLVCDTHLAVDGLAISYLGVPIAAKDKIIVGSLCVFEARERQWSAADVGMLTQLSMVLTRALPDVSTASTT